MRITIKVANVDRCVVDNVAGHSIGRKHQAVVGISLALALNIRVHLNAESMLKGKAVAVTRDKRVASPLAISKYVILAIGAQRAVSQLVATEHRNVA